MESTGLWIPHLILINSTENASNECFSNITSPGVSISFHPLVCVWGPSPVFLALLLGLFGHGLPSRSHPSFTCSLRPPDLLTSPAHTDHLLLCFWPFIQQLFPGHHSQSSVPSTWVHTSWTLRTLIQISWLDSVGAQDRLNQNSPQWHTDYFELKLFGQ